MARKGPWVTALIGTLLLALIFGSGIIDKRTEIIPSRQSFASFPTDFGDWHGRQDKLTPDVLDALQLTDYWLANYARPKDTGPVDLYISYYATQRIGSMTHSPSNCIPGGGWQITSSRVTTLTLQDGTVLSLTRLLIRQAEDTELVYYWFDERGRDLTETPSAKWYLFWDSIFMHRTDGALVRLMSPVNAGETEAIAESRLKDFLDTFHPTLKAYIPGAPKASGSTP